MQPNTTQKQRKGMEPHRPNPILVNRNQSKNPVLENLGRLTSYVFADKLYCDFVLGEGACALFLSVKYHRMYPDYIYERLKRLKNKHPGQLRDWDVKVVLLYIDDDNPDDVLEELNIQSIFRGFCLIIAYGKDEAANALVSFKQQGNITSDEARGKLGRTTETQDDVRLAEALKSTHVLSKTDADTLIRKYGSLRRIAQASSYELSQLYGFGSVKVKKFTEIMSQSFLASPTAPSASVSVSTSATTSTAALPRGQLQIDQILRRSGDDGDAVGDGSKEREQDRDGDDHDTHANMEFMEMDEEYE